MNLEDPEQSLRDRLEALGPAPRAEPLHVLTMPDYERAGRIGEYYGNPITWTFAELLITCEEDRYVRAVIVGLLRERERPRLGALASLGERAPRSSFAPQRVPSQTCRT